MDKLSPAELDALARIEKEPDLRPFFFKRASNLKWFFPLLERGFFDPKSLPVAESQDGRFTVAFWPQADYLAAISREAGDTSLEMSKRLLDVVRSITASARDAGGSNYRIWWQFAKVLRNLPHEILSLEDVEAVAYWLSDPVETGLIVEEASALLEDLLKARTEHADELSVRLIAALFKVSILETEKYGRVGKEAMLTASTYSIGRAAERVAHLSGERIGITAVRMFIERLAEVVRQTKEDDWSSIWRPSIEQHEQNRSGGDPEDVFVEAVKAAFYGLLDSRSADAFCLVGELLSHDLKICRRIGLWAADQDARVFLHVAERLVNPDFLRAHYRHEYWTVLANRFDQFTESQRQEIVGLINNIQISDDAGSLSIGATAYQQAVWYAALRSYGFEEAYAARVSTAGAEPEHPDFSSYSWAGAVSHKSDFSVEDLLSLKAQELVTVLNEYSASYDKIARGFDSPDLEGLAKTLREAVKTEPVRFHLTLSELTALRATYIYEIIEGYGELWIAKSALPWSSIWERLLSFIGRVFDDANFWGQSAPPAGTHVGTVSWVANSVGKLLENAVRSDEHAVDQTHHAQIRCLIDSILSRQPGESFESDSDAVFIAINSPRGQALEAMINLALRDCRLAGGAKQEAWEKYGDAFLSELRGKACEASVLIPMYLPNFLYMSKSWVLDNFDEIFVAPSSGRTRWKCSMEGYSSVSSVYDEIYQRLRDLGHFSVALRDSSLRDRVHERIVQNVGVAYLAGKEDLRGELFEVILGNEALLAHLVWFIWTARSGGKTKMGRVVELWEAILKGLDLSTRGGRRIASKLCSWIELVSVLDDRTTGLLIMIAPFVDEEHEGYTLLEGISRLMKEFPFAAADIWESMLSGSAAGYPEEAIESALDALIGNGQEGVRRAQVIASMYMKCGNDSPGQYLISKGAV